MKRIATIGMLMLCSEVLLCAFLATWLMAQWRNEDENLRKDLRLKFIGVTGQATDSLIKSNLSKSRRIGDPGTALIIEQRDSPLRAQPLQQEHHAVVVHKQVWSNGPDSLTVQEDPDTMANIFDGIQTILATLLPDSVQRQLAVQDTSLIRSMFIKALAADKMHFTVHWMPPGASERNGSILLRGNGMNRLHVVEVTSYISFLLRRILSQILFALTLIAITSLAFLLALRSLRRERRLSVMRSSLVSNMSHELKTPVTTVKVALEALTDEAVLQDVNTVREYVSIANQELQRLEMLVNQTLHTSLMESGKLPIQRAPINLKVLTNELVNTLHPRVVKQQAQIELSFNNGDYTIQADRLHVQGVLLNIIDNALKYGGAAVRIRVRGESSRKAVCISISDSGPGIPQAYQSRVFEKFFRVPAGDLHDVKGYGLGLSYAAEVMRLHGGTILLSEAEGGGCTFLLQFPKETIT